MRGRLIGGEEVEWEPILLPAIGQKTVGEGRGKEEENWPDHTERGTPSVTQLGSEMPLMSNKVPPPMINSTLVQW